MFSATDFLPWRMMEFMNFETTKFPNFGSGWISRFSALWRRDIVCFPLGRSNGHSFDPVTQRGRSLRPLGSVFRSPLLAVLHALRVEHAAQNVVAHAGQVLHAAPADHHHRVLLQIVALARNVADDLEAVGQAHLRHLAQRRVGLLRRRRVDARANPALLRRRLQRRHGIARLHPYPWLTDQLIDRRHSLSVTLGWTATSLFLQRATQNRHRTKRTKRKTEKRRPLPVRWALTRSRQPRLRMRPRDRHFDI